MLRTVRFFRAEYDVGYVPITADSMAHFNSLREIFRDSLSHFRFLIADLVTDVSVAALSRGKRSSGLRSRGVGGQWKRCPRARGSWVGRRWSISSGMSSL